VGGAAARAGIRRGEELPGDGPAGGAADGAAGCDCGFTGCAQGPGGDKAWGVPGVDW